jgi:hypothetical protein
VQRHLVKLGFLIAIAVGWWIWRAHILTPTPLPHPAAGSAAVGSASKHEVRQVSREAREHLASQILAAHEARVKAAAAAAAAAGSAAVAGSAAEAAAAAAAAAAAGGVPPNLSDHTHDLDHLSQPVFDALQGALPFLAECYKQGSGSGERPSVAVAVMTLSNDPDIGAVIDPDQILDDKQQPLDPAIDACLRGTMQTLALPPLDAGDVVKLQYSFKLD